METDDRGTTGRIGVAPEREKDPWSQSLICCLNMQEMMQEWRFYQRSAQTQDDSSADSEPQEDTEHI